VSEQFPPEYYRFIKCDPTDVSPLGLTSEELEVLGHLASAWNKFTKLNNKHGDHNNEFRDAIHKLQYIIGVRVAQRVNPEVWYVPVQE
jgi:hypothetical protein